VLAPADINEIALDPIRSLPEEAFLDTMATFIRDVDGVFFNDRGLSPEQAVRIRSVLAERLKETGRWRNMVRRRSTGIETHLGPAAGVMFFNNHGFVQPTTAYLLPKGIDRLEPFLPLLERLTRDAPCLFIAIVTLNLIEVSPRTEHAFLLTGASTSWVSAFPDDKEFWIDYGVGRRACALLDVVLIKSEALFGPLQAIRSDVEAILAAMVRVGVPEAARLEQAIADALAAGN
jgi:hypothetical protein